MDQYKEKLFGMIETGEEVNASPGSFSMIQVKHDTWCGIFTGKECNCDPEFVLESVE
jgi:hypothetical protein